MELETLVARMKKASLKELEQICVSSGVPYSTALKIRGGFTKNPGILTVKALELYFSDQAAA